MKDYKSLAGKEIRIRKYGYGKVLKIGKETFTFKIPVDDMKWEKIELNLRFLNHAKVVKDSELDNKRFRISFITRNFYKKMFSGTGRTTRKEFFFGRLSSMLFLLIPTGVLTYFILINEPKKLFVYLGLALLFFGFLTFIGTINLTARRLQDLGYKGIYSLIFYTIILSLLSYGWWNLEQPFIFTCVMGAIYLIFELIMIFTVSDFDNKYGPCPIANLDDDDHVDGKEVIKKEGSFSNMKEFTERIKSDNLRKEEEKIQEEKIKEAEERILKKQKEDKAKRKEEEKKREEKGESIKELSERIRREATHELEENPERLRKLPKKEEKEITEKLALEKIEKNKLIKEYSKMYEKGEISKAEYNRLIDEL